MKSIKSETILFIILGLGIVYIFFMLFYIPVKSETDFWESQIYLEELDSFRIDVNVVRKNRAALSFNGRYSTDVMTLNYHRLNGQRFKWENFYAPFKLEKEIGNDTIVLRKGDKEYYFLLIQE